MTSKEFKTLTKEQEEQLKIEIKAQVMEETKNMTPEEISDKFQELRSKRDFNSVLDAKETIYYHEYWKLWAMNDPEGKWSEKDQVKFPRFGWVSGEWIESVGLISKALNKIKGVKSSEGTLYQKTCYHNGRMAWFLQFDSITTLQHFLWAGCFRYFPLTHNNDWLLTVDNGDPRYNEVDKIRMILQYQNLEADRNTWEDDLKQFAEGLERYAAEEDSIKSSLDK